MIVKVAYCIDDLLQTYNGIIKIFSHYLSFCDENTRKDGKLKKLEKKIIDLKYSVLFNSLSIYTHKYKTLSQESLNSLFSTFYERRAA